MTDHDQYFDYLSGRSRLGAIYRRHWLYPKLARRLSGKVLDVGCGIGDMLDFLPSSVGVDVNPKTVAYCRSRGLRAEVMVPDQLPFEDGSFDSVLMDNVLEHIAAPSLLLAEVDRVLRAQGRLMVGVPGARGWHSDTDHKVFYDEMSLRTRLAEAGFSLIEILHMPLVRSDWLARKLRQYCIYGVFVRA